MRIKPEIWRSIFRVNIFLVLASLIYNFIDPDTISRLRDLTIVRLVFTIFILYVLIFLAFYLFKDKEGYISAIRMVQALIVLIIFIIIHDLITGLYVTNSVIDIFSNR